MNNWPLPGIARRLHRTCTRLILGGLALATLSASGGAIRNLPGFTTTVFEGNDDDTYPMQVPIGFNLTFYDIVFTDLYVNNNGNVTFDAPLRDFTPFGLAGTSTRIIAPFFADVDTRTGNLVTFGNDTVDGHAAFGVNWFGVGYFYEHTDKLNSFQLILINRSDRNPGDFDIEFNYDRVQWESGDASDGIGGFGGESAVAGFSNGTGAPGGSFQLPGSAVPGSFLDSNPSGLAHGSLNSALPGRYVFSIVNVTNVVLNVPLFSQYDSRWANNVYGHSSFNVQEKGSALCCLAMLLKFGGVATDPGALNPVIDTAGDYVGTGVNWDAAVRDASGGTLAFHAYRTTETSYLNEILNIGHPVIVAVNFNSQGEAGHYVAVIGKQEGHFVIHDPGHSGFTTLDSYSNVFETRGYISGSVDGLSGLDASVNDPVDVLLIDPALRRTGYSPISVFLEEIPGTAHFLDCIEDEELTDTSGSDTAHTVPSFQPVAGDYLLYVIGKKSGGYKLDVRSFAANGASQTPLTIQGTTVPGRIDLAKFAVSSSGIALNSFKTNCGLAPLYTFLGSSDGSEPYGNLVQAGDGGLFGTTVAGGSNSMGTVFKIATNGMLSRLYSFGSVLDFGLALDGAQPYAGLALGHDGNFYGVTAKGGEFDYGSVFRISPTGALTTLYSFGTLSDYTQAPLDGAYPQDKLLLAKDGNFYGIAPMGGNYSSGTFFRITPDGSFAVLYSFGSFVGALGEPLDGGQPQGAIVQGRDGNFYGTTTTGGTNSSGTIFQMSPGGLLTTLHCLGSVTNESGVAWDGATPYGGLVLGADDALYGTTGSGGSNGFGTIFRITTNGVFTTLYAFGGQPDGAAPHGQLSAAADGSFYGTTFNGGAPGGGTLFRYTPGGPLTALYSFVGASDGARPAAGVLLASDGKLYGTAIAGGTNASGVIFRLGLGAPAFLIQPQGQTVIAGSNVVLSATVSSDLPVTYQWQFDGSNIVGATDSVLLLPGVQGTNSGNYVVVVSNAFGSVSSAAIGLRVLPVLKHVRGANNINLIWIGSYALQSSASAGGPYADVPNASSPYPVALNSASQRFFRLRAGTAGVLGPAIRLGNGQFKFNVAGLAGYNYAVLASTNLLSWVPLQTNPVPYVFTDSYATNFTKRFYRSLWLP